VGAVVLNGELVLLARRGRPPGQGKWSIPGGLVHLGERIEDAVVREIEEESGLLVRGLGFCGVIDRVVREQDAVRYHYVIIDYVAESVGGRLQAGSDAAEVRWVALDDIPKYDTTDGLADMIRRARAIQRAAPAKSSQSGGPIR
jgi:ADP-ribose pyrophosphatase YjhB (NUDIX family)